jgi:lysozyme
MYRDQYLGPARRGLDLVTRLINSAGMSLVQRFEGLYLTAYDDGGGTLTIGYGHTGPDVIPGLTITEARANELLIEDLAGAAAAIQKLAPAADDNEFSALVSLAFNVGVEAVSNSTVLRLFRAGDKMGAAEAFLLWDKMHINGVLTKTRGLLRRRLAEAELFLT